jgi:small subunit ribosomal protein S7e
LYLFGHICGLLSKVSASELKADLHDLYISAAKELELDGGRKAIIIFVPFRQLKDFHKIQSRLVRELEKKFR